MADFDPSARSSDYNVMNPYWEKVADILAGQEAIKGKSYTYLPKNPDETDASYIARLGCAVFTNIYADISKNLAAKPFAKELTLTEKAGERFAKLSENIDGKGNNLHVFCEDTFKSGFDYAISWILVDYTKPREREDGKPLSKAEESEQGLRPYWTMIPARKVLAPYSAFANGVETLIHAAVDESSIEFDGTSERMVERIRVMRRDPLVNAEGSVEGYGPAYWELWEKRGEARRKKTWELVDRGEYSIGVIPMVPFFSGRRRGSGFVAEPVLRDLLNMQFAEYQQESNLEWVKVMTCFPMLCISGVNIADDKGNIAVKVGPNQVIGIPQNSQGTGPAGAASYIEPTTASIKEVREQLELFRKEMRDIGMQPLTTANLTVVTTANVAMKASSVMQAQAILFKDAVEQAWKLTAMWLGSTDEPEVIVHTDFSIDLEEGKQLDSILSAVGQKVISKKTARAEMKRRGVISNDLADEEEEQRLAEESEGLEEEEPTDPKTGKLLQEREAA